MNMGMLSTELLGLLDYLITAEEATVVAAVHAGPVYHRLDLLTESR